MATEDRPAAGGEGLNPTRRLAIGFLALSLGAVGFAAGRTTLRPTQHVTQPIQFNHQKHVQGLGLECSTCHEYFSTGNHSGLPSLALCKGCHAEALTSSPEEQKLLKLTDPLPRFQKLFRLPDHTRYSHRRHVVSGGLACQTCHGPIERMRVVGSQTGPRLTNDLVRLVGLKAAPPPLTMGWCVDCHRAENAKGQVHLRRALGDDASSG